MRFLIAGAGSIGQRHLRNLQALGEHDITLYRTFLGTLQSPELEKFPVDHTLEAALARHPDAVIISNPTRLHLEIAIPAARAGCHLLLEKPVSDSMDLIPELQEAMRAGGSRVLVGYHFRFHPGLLQVKQLLDAGAIGRLLSARAHWGEYLPGWHPWEDYRQGYSARVDLGGGVILTLSHPLDYLAWLLGEVSAVWALSARAVDLDIPVESVAEIGLRFTNGALGSVHLDYCQRPASHRLELIGTQGTITWDNSDGSARIFQAGSSSWQELSPPAGFDRDQLFRSEMRHFLDLVRGDVLPACTLDDGLRALKLCLAAHQSVRSGGLVTGVDSS